MIIWDKLWQIKRYRTQILQVIGLNFLHRYLSSPKQHKACRNYVLYSGTAERSRVRNKDLNFIRRQSDNCRRDDSQQWEHDLKCWEYMWEHGLKLCDKLWENDLK